MRRPVGRHRSLICVFLVLSGNTLAYTSSIGLPGLLPDGPFYSHSTLFRSVQGSSTLPQRAILNHWTTGYYLYQHATDAGSSLVGVGGNGQWSCVLRLASFVDLLSALHHGFRRALDVGSPFLLSDAGPCSYMSRHATSACESVHECMVGAIVL